MSVHRLHKEHFIKAPIKEVWNFFSSAKNLEVITPPYMKMRITSGVLPEDVYPGQIITYTVSPVLGVPLFWMTEITTVVKEKLFVDEQRKGPYSLWHHQHHFKEENGGVLMTDIVHYQLPLGILGEAANLLFAARQVKGIFDFRNEKIAEIFPE